MATRTFLVGHESGSLHVRCVTRCVTVKIVPPSWNASSHSGFRESRLRRLHGGRAALALLAFLADRWGRRQRLVGLALRRSWSTMRSGMEPMPISTSCDAMNASSQKTAPSMKP